MTELHVNDSQRKLVFAPTSPIEKVIEDIEIFAPTNKNILITGENGTGKETIARLIHQGSDRKQHNFSAINCGGIPESLLESTLFGHEKGAFTGADRPRMGAFEAANGGTLFLDEIGEMSPGMQVRLMRVLQEGVVTRLGSNDPIKVTPRIIAATNIDTDKALKEGKLRKDLFYRLRGVQMHVPDLQSRKVDIPLLAEFFAEKTAKEAGWSDDEKPPFDREAIRALTEHSWPGNVRELENMVSEAVIRAHHAKSAVTPNMLRWPEGKSEKLEFSAGASVDVGALITRFGKIPVSKIAMDAGMSRATVDKYVSETPPEPSSVEKLALYLYKRDGPSGARTFFDALMKRLIAQEQATDKHLEAGQRL